MTRTKMEWRILAFAAVFALALTGCNNETPNDNGKEETSVGADPVGGKMTYIISMNDLVVGLKGSKINFKTTAKTYTMSSPKRIQVWDDEEGEYFDGGYDLKNGKYQWEETRETGTYTWNTTTQTLTLTPTKVRVSEKMMSQAEYRTDRQDVIDETIASLVAGDEEEGVPGMTQAEAEQYLLTMYGPLFGFIISGGVTTIAELIDGMVNMDFADKPYNYSFSSDGEALFLQKALPAPKGTDELKGKTYYMGNREWDDETEEYKVDEQGNPVYEKDTNEVYTFGTNRTYTLTYYGDDAYETGTYSYDSTSKMVYIRFSNKLLGDITLGDKTPAEYYADMMEDEGIEWDEAFPDKAASCVAVTNFMVGGYVLSMKYDPKEMIFSD